MGWGEETKREGRKRDTEVDGQRGGMEGRGWGGGEGIKRKERRRDTEGEGE